MMSCATSGMVHMLLSHCVAAAVTHPSRFTSFVGCAAVTTAPAGQCACRWAGGNRSTRKQRLWSLTRPQAATSQAAGCSVLFLTLVNLFAGCLRWVSCMHVHSSCPALAADENVRCQDSDDFALRLLSYLQALPALRSLSVSIQQLYQQQSSLSRRHPAWWVMALKRMYVDMCRRHSATLTQSALVSDFSLLNNEDVLSWFDEQYCGSSALRHPQLSSDVLEHVSDEVLMTARLPGLESLHWITPTIERPAPPLLARHFTVWRCGME